MDKDSNVSNNILFTDFKHPNYLIMRGMPYFKQ